MSHINPLHWNIDVVLGLDHINVDEILLLGPEQLILSDTLTRVHIGVNPLSNDELVLRHLIHAKSWLLDLVGGLLDIALLGIGALWSFLIAKPLRSRVAAGIRAMGSGATTYDTEHKTYERNEKGHCKDQSQNKQNK